MADVKRSQISVFGDALVVFELELAADETRFDVRDADGRAKSSTRGTE